MSPQQHEARKRNRKRRKRKDKKPRPPGFPLQLGGKTYYAKPPGRAELEEMEQFILANRRSPLEIAKEQLDGLPVELQKQLLRDALAQESSMRDSISEIEFAAALDTREGAAKMFWLMLRANHPEVKQEDVMGLIEQATDAEFGKLLEQRENFSAGAV